MKKSFILLACLALIAGSVMGQQVATASPDLARHEINGGKVKSYDEVDSEGVDVNHAEFNAKGIEKFAPGMKVKRDKKGRVSNVLYTEGTGFDKNTVVDTFYYKANECRPYLHYISSENISGSFIEAFSDMIHAEYSDNSNQPSTCMLIESDMYGFTTYISYGIYTYTEKDRYNNWIKNTVTLYEYQVDNTEGVNDQVAQQLKDLGVILSNPHISEAKRKQTEAKLIGLLKKHIQPSVNYYHREIQYYK